jgi:hypothetical protein
MCPKSSETPVFAGQERFLKKRDEKGINSDYSDKIIQINGNH